MQRGTGVVLVAWVLIVGAGCERMFNNQWFTRSRSEQDAAIHKPDAGEDLDASVPDAADVADASVASDGAVAVDASVVMDGGAPLDASVPDGAVTPTGPGGSALMQTAGSVRATSANFRLQMSAGAPTPVGRASSPGFQLNAGPNAGP